MSNYLNTIKQKKKTEDIIIVKNDQIIIEEVYFWIKISLKSTFEFFLSHKINVQQGFMIVYKKLCMQNAIW